jgi:hypothetical protein
VLVAFGPMIAAFAVISAAAPTASATVHVAPAVIINDQGRAVIDAVLKCPTKGEPNSMGKASTYDIFGCTTTIGFTTDSHESVSACFNVKLTCRY